MARSSCGGDVDEADGVGSGRSPTGANGLSSPAHSTSQRYTLPTPQNTRWSSRTSARLAPGVVVGQQQLDAAAEVGVGAAQVRPEPAEAGVAAGVGRAVRLDDRGVEADRRPAVDLDQRPHLVVRPLPALAGAVEVPRPAHPHVRVQDDAVVPLDLEVLAVALHRSTVRPARGVMPIRRGASKRTIFLSTSAVRSAAAARWMVSPSGIARPTVGRRCARRSGMRGAGGYGQLADVGEGEAEQAVVAAGHLLPHRRADRLGRREPGQVERLLRRLAVAVDGHDVGQAHGVVPGVVEARAVGVGEVLDDRERRRIGRQAGQRQRPEVLLEVAHQRRRGPARRTAPAR